MAVTLDDTKRNAIASKLADMKAIQELLISAEQQMSEINDDESRKDIRRCLTLIRKIWVF